MLLNGEAPIQAEGQTQKQWWRLSAEMLSNPAFVGPLTPSKYANE